jgi:hypothetical protein
MLKSSDVVLLLEPPMFPSCLPTAAQLLLTYAQLGPCRCCCMQTNHHAAKPTSTANSVLGKDTPDIKTM